MDKNLETIINLGDQAGQVLKAIGDQYKEKTRFSQRKNHNSLQKNLRSFYLI